MEELLAQGWVKEVAPNGKITYRRPDGRKVTRKRQLTKLEDIAIGEILFPKKKKTVASVPEEHAVREEVVQEVDNELQSEDTVEEEPTVEEATNDEKVHKPIKKYITLFIFPDAMRQGILPENGQKT
jgi:hypothetical protein